MALGDMGHLEKLTIRPLPPSKLPPILVLFNPNAYSITKAVTWTAPASASGGNTQTSRAVNAPLLEFGGGASRQLTLELFFDVTEPLERFTTDDVRNETNKVVALTLIERGLKRPPVCEVSWGNAPTGSDFPFMGVVTNLTQRFTLFDVRGTPLRATLTVTFLEFLKPDDDERKHDPEQTTRVVRLGDTLAGIAADVYRDPSLWRLIAAANRIEDPRHLDPGVTLTIPARL